MLNVFIHVDLTLELWRRNYGNDWTPTHEALRQNYRIIYRGKFYKRGSEFLSGLSNCQEIPIWLINRVIVPKKHACFCCVSADVSSKGWLKAPACLSSLSLLEQQHICQHTLSEAYASKHVAKSTLRVPVQSPWWRGRMGNQNKVQYTLLDAECNVSSLLSVISKCLPATASWHLPTLRNWGLQNVINVERAFWNFWCVALSLHWHG